MVRNTGIANSMSCQGIRLHRAITMPPMTTNVAAAACAGTTAAIGVRNRVAANQAPVPTLPTPVRAPSPTPAADSRNTVFGTEPVTPPLVPTKGLVLEKNSGTGDVFRAHRDAVQCQAGRRADRRHDRRRGRDRRRFTDAAQPIWGVRV